jgi:glycosyltransferase involved in cell wall biosynthesis
VHILFLTDNFPPEVNAPASRTHEHCRRWVEQGYQVTVITCAPNFPRGQVLEGYRNRLWQQETVDGIRVIRVWSYIAPNQGFAKRIADYLSYMVSAFLAAIFVRRIDVIVGTSPQFFTSVAAFATSVVKRRPWIFELRDLWPESIRAVGAMESGRLLDWCEKLELFLYRQADAIVAVTHSFKRNLITRGVEGGKIHVVTNGVDIARFSPLARDEDLARELDLEGRFVAGYIGTLGMAHGLDTLLDAAAILRTDSGDEGVEFLFLGDGACSTALRHRAETEGLDNVHFVPTVLKSEVPRYWSLLDVSIIHLRRSETFKAVIPSKLFECMAMGVPILHGIEGESAEIVALAKCGVLFEPENARQLADLLMALRNDHAKRRALSRGGLTSAGDFDRRKLADDMLAILDAAASAR